MHFVAYEPSRDKFGMQRPRRTLGPAWILPEQAVITMARLIGNHT
jgi:hypothetical protein